MTPTIRLWVDELEGLPEYSLTIPTGTYPGKQWRRWVRDRWFIGTYLERAADGTIGYAWHVVELLHGPRRPFERSRLNPRGRPPK